jgi:16S rRNA (adenine1518-N6/adenine1519-N6)-dimethyltransferase
VRIAGNLPYNISTPLIGRLVGLARDTGRVADAVLMVQLEVANRLSASPGSGDYGPLTVFTQLWADVDLALRLPPGAFRPPPRVQSAVVALRFRPPVLEMASPALFDRLVRAIFLQRRKMLSNALQPFAASLGVSAPEALARAGIDGRRRPETLALVELARLAAALDRRG